MSERKSRPTSFAEAATKTQWGMEESIDLIAKWSEDEQQRLKDAENALLAESGDKGFFGQLATWGTTLGCVTISGPGNIGGCVALGTAVGSAARGVVDYFGEAEDLIPTGVSPIDTKYYAAKIPEITDDLEAGANTLRDYNANEWKQDALLQLGDTLSALKMASMGETLLGGEEAAKTLAEDKLSVDTEETIIQEIMDPLLDLNLEEMEG